MKNNINGQIEEIEYKKELLEGCKRILEENKKPLLNMYLENGEIKLEILEYKKKIKIKIPEDEENLRILLEDKEKSLSYKLEIFKGLDLEDKKLVLKKLESQIKYLETNF